MGAVGYGQSREGLHSQHIPDPDTDFPGGRGFRKRMKEVELGKWGEAGLKVGHVSEVGG